MAAGSSVKISSPGWMSLEATMYLPTTGSFLMVYNTLELCIEAGGFESTPFTGRRLPMGEDLYLDRPPINTSPLVTTTSTTC